MAAGAVEARGYHFYQEQTSSFLAGCLARSSPRGRHRRGRTGADAEPPDVILLDLGLHDQSGLDRLFLPRVLEAAGGNQHEAARRLGIARETLRRRLRELGLHVSRFEPDDGDLS